MGDRFLVVPAARETFEELAAVVDPRPSEVGRSVGGNMGEWWGTAALGR